MSLYADMFEQGGVNGRSRSRLLKLSFALGLVANVIRKRNCCILWLIFPLATNFACGQE